MSAKRDGYLAGVDPHPLPAPFHLRKQSRVIAGRQDLWRNLLMIIEIPALQAQPKGKPRHPIAGGLPPAGVEIEEVKRIRRRDELSRERRELPWEKLEKQYVFEGLGGKVTLADLFGERHQLVVYHFMFGPGWKEGCPSCSYLADHFDGAAVHLAHRDVTLAVVSRATLAEIETFKKRMGWRFKWVSSFGSDFNYDCYVSLTKDDKAKGKVFYNYELGEFPSEEAPGASVFYKNEVGEIFHTYSTYARGLDILVGTYNFLDLAPKGRDEGGLAHKMAWVRHHDRYNEGYFVDASQLYKAPKSTDAACCSGEERK
ncbi:MAG: thioredoxin family protein [Terriglobia bacterium]